MRLCGRGWPRKATPSAAWWVVVGRAWGFPSACSRLPVTPTSAARHPHFSRLCGRKAAILFQEPSVI